MEFLSLLYTVLLVAICLLQALLLYRSGKQAPRQDDEALKEWVRQQLDAQSKLFAQKQAELARQNYDAMRGISETLQTAVQGMSSTLNAGQAAQQQTMEQRLQGLEASNARKLEEMRKTLAESMAALQAQNAQKLDEIRCTVDEQLQDALQKRVTESFKAVNAQLEQVSRPAASWARSSWEPFWKKFWPQSSTTPMWPPSPAAPSGWSTLSKCRVPTAAVSGCRSTPSSPVIPTPTCRMRRHPAMRRLWKTPAMHWNWCCAARPRTSAKSMWSRLIPQPSASCFCPSRACTPKW